MSKKISSLITAAAVAIFMLMSSFTTVYADNYKNWLQSDSRWSGKTLGGSGETMREIGCAVTSVAIQVVHSGSRSENNFNPGTLVDYLNKSGGLDSGGNLYWGAVTGLVSSFTFEKRAYFASQTKTNIIKELTNYINAGYYVVMSVDYDCHWVAVDTISNGVVYMMDPAQNKTNKLFDYYNVGGMLQVRLFKGKNAPAKVGSGSNATPGTTAPSTTEPPATTDTSGNVYLTGHYLTTDPLNLRESHSTSSDVVLTIPENSTIVVTRIYNNSWGETEYDGKTGWVYMGYTKYTEAEYSYTAGTYKCTSDTGVNMRSGIGTDKSIVCLIPYKAKVTISSVSHNWGKATYGSYTGYICMDYLEYVPDSSETTTVTTKATTAATTTTTTTKAATTTAATTTTTKAATTTAATTTTTKATTTTAATTTTTKATTTTAATTTTTKATTTTAATTTTTKATTTTAATTTTTKAATTTAASTTSISTPSSAITSVITSVSVVLKGDINKDGKLDKDDVLKLNLYIIKPVKLDILTTYIYDMNTDGVINEIDVIYLMKAIKKQMYSSVNNK